VNVIPFRLLTRKAIFIGYCEADLFSSAGGYSQSGILNIGQHNLAAAPVAGFTTAQRSKSEVSSRLLLLHGYDKDTHYHGATSSLEYNADYEISRNAAGFNGISTSRTTNRYLTARFSKAGFADETWPSAAVAIPTRHAWRVSVNTIAIP